MNKIISTLALTFFIFFVGATLNVSAAFAATYYVDSSLGNDSNAGTTQSAPWKSMSKVNSSSFQAGDQILFKRGQTFTIAGNGMLLNGDGSSSNRITLGAYGTGNNPVLSNTNSSNKYIYVVGVWGKFWTIRDIKIMSTAGNVIEDGVRVWNGDVIIDSIEVTGIAKAVKMHGSNSEIKNSNFHDLIMLVNTSGGNDDVGAIGIEVTQNGAAVSNVNIHHNIFKNLRPTSFDYGHDGAAVEFFDSVSNVQVYSNWIENVDSFTELGGFSSGKVISNVAMHHNVILDPKIISFVNNGGDYPISFDGIKIENNTIVKKSTVKEGYGIGFWNPPASGKFFFRNNIVYYRNTASDFVYNGGSFNHTHNVYDLAGIGSGNASTPNFALSTGEMNASPQFIDMATNNFHLQAGSPAVNAGIAGLGYAADYDGVTIPQGSWPDIGAFEYNGVVASPTPSPSASPATTPTPVVTPSPVTSPSPSILPSPSPTTCQQADINQDGTVNILDYTILVSNFFSTTPNPARADINKDGMVNILDFTILAGQFFQSC